MRRWLTVAALFCTAGACDNLRDVAAPARPTRFDPALSKSLATAGASDQLEVIVNYDETATTRDAVTSAVLELGAGVVQFKHLDLLAALATPSQLDAMAAVRGVQGIYLNKRLTYYGNAASGLLLLHESIPTIRADAVQASGITGKGMGIAILDTGIDGLYNPDLQFPDKTIQNMKVIFNLSDVATFVHQDRKALQQGASLVVENLPNSETSTGHGTHVAGISAGDGTASTGYYTGVAPGANLIGLGTGDILFIFWALAGFDYILEHQQDFNIKVVNNSWGRTARLIRRTRSTRPRRSCTGAALPWCSRPATRGPTRTR